MEDVASRLLRSVRRIVPCGENEVTMAGGEGGEIVGRLDPALEEVLRRAAAEQCPAGATLTARDGEAHRIVVWSLGGADSAVALEAEPLEQYFELAIETLVDQIAHDVRNLAFTIGLQAELGERRPAAPEVKGHFVTVLRQVTVLRHYLDRLLLYGRRARPNAAPCDVARLVQQWVSEFSFSRRESAPPLDIRVAAEGGAGHALWDGTMLGKAFGELLDNAVRSSEPPPPVTITTSGGPTTVSIEIRDEGNGIPEEVLSLLATPTRARRPGGAGLGVAIARKLIKAHGGTLQLRSGSDGTVATLNLPREVSAG